MAYIGNLPAVSYASFSKQNLTADGSTVAFTLDFAVANENDLEVFVNNVRQEPGSGKAYTASGTTLTMSEAPTSGASFYVIFQGKATQTVVPPDGSVTNAKLANSSITINGTSIALGASGDIVAGTDWQSVVVADGSTGLITVAGEGYFIDTTSGAITVTLPSSPTAGDTVVLKDYARTWATNNVTLASTLMDGATTTSAFSTNGQTVTIVYMDGTKGWTLVNDDTTSKLEIPPTYISATGGTVTESGDYKIHTFTGDGCFVVSSLGNPEGGGSNVDYLVVAGGGGGGRDAGGGGGGGGFRLSNSTCMTAPLTSPLANPTGLTVTSTTYPITVGGGGSSDPGPSGTPAASRSGSDSIFSTITAAGGGGAGNNCNPQGGAGGSGGGTGRNGTSLPQAGAGNTPPVSPPQGNPGAFHPGSGDIGGGGGGAGGTTPAPSVNGDGGVGSFVISTGFAGCNGTPGPVSDTRYFSGGGVGGHNPSSIPCASQIAGAGGGGSQGPGGGVAGSTNTGGGGGAGDAAGPVPQAAGGGGSGIVIIRYKFQN